HVGLGGTRQRIRCQGCDDRDSLENSLKMSRLGRLRWGLPLGAVALAVVPFPATAVERWYSNGVYGRVQPLLTRLSNLAPFALLDLAACLVIAAFLALTVKELAAVGWQRALWRGLGRLVVWGAACYIVFALAWGLNYRRVRLETRVPFDASAVTA